MIGGTALNVLGIVERPTKDIDVVALADADESGAVRIGDARPLPQVLLDAVHAVGREFGIEQDWLNNGPADLLDAGLPVGFEKRLESQDYGTALAVHFAGRLDQVCFKTYAAADLAGRHLADLLALDPTHPEMDFALRWTMSQDPSDGFFVQLAALADYLEVRHVLDRIER